MATKTSTQRQRILIVEDEINVRQRLALAIAAAPGLEIAGAVGSLGEARPLLAQLLPEVLVVDLGLPDGNGTELIREAVALSPDINVMVITVFGDEAHVVSAIEAGATSYLLKDSSSAHVVRSIAQMLDGGSPISASVARFLLRRMQSPVKPSSPVKPAATPAMPFSVRELDVLNLIAQGLAYHQIGENLGITVNTVATHIKQIYRKLSVNSRGRAVFEAQAQGLIPRSDKTD